MKSFYLFSMGLLLLHKSSYVVSRSDVWSEYLLQYIVIQDKASLNKGSFNIIYDSLWNFNLTQLADCLASRVPQCSFMSVCHVCLQTIVKSYLNVVSVHDFSGVEDGGMERYEYHVTFDTFVGLRNSNCCGHHCFR